MAIESALDVVSKYVVALSLRDSAGMNGLRAEDFLLDFVHSDAFEHRPMSAQETQMFWPIWFDAFADLDLEVIRTIAADEVVVTQWIFTGTNTGPLDPPIFEERVEPTGRTVRLRGVSVYDIINGRVWSLFLICVTVMPYAFFRLRKNAA